MTSDDGVREILRHCIRENCGTVKLADSTIASALAVGSVLLFDGLDELSAEYNWRFFEARQQPEIQSFPIRASFISLSRPLDHAPIEEATCWKIGPMDDNKVRMLLDRFVVSGRKRPGSIREDL